MGGGTNTTFAIEAGWENKVTQLHCTTPTSPPHHHPTPQASIARRVRKHNKTWGDWAGKGDEEEPSRVRFVVDGAKEKDKTQVEGGRRGVEGKRESRWGVESGWGVGIGVGWVEVGLGEWDWRGVGHFTALPQHSCSVPPLAYLLPYNAPFLSNLVSGAIPRGV